MKYLIITGLLLLICLVFCTENDKKQRIKTSVIEIDLPINFRIVDTGYNYAIFEHGLIQKKKISITKSNSDSEIEIIDSYINRMSEIDGYTFEVSELYFSEFWGGFAPTKTLKIKRYCYDYEFTVIALKRPKSWYLVVVSSVFADHNQFFDSVSNYKCWVM